MAITPIPVSRASRREPLAAAYWFLIVFMVIDCARPEDWIPGLHLIPLAKIAAILALIALLLAIGQIRQRFPREMIYLLLLSGQLFVTVPFAIWRGGAFQGALAFAKVVAIVLVIVLAVRTAKRLRWLVFTQTAALAVVAAVSVVKGRMAAGRLEGVLNGSFSNSNDLALGIAITLPLCLVFLFRSKSRLRKVLWALAMLVMVYAIYLTQSRAGLLSLIVAAAFCLWDFSIRGRRRYLLAIVPVTVLVLGLLVGQGLRNRFDAIFSESNQSQQSAYESAQARREIFIKSLEVTATHPFLGIGPGNFPIISGSWHVTHNSYTQMSAEAGIPALLLYVLILWRGFKNTGTIKRIARGRREAVLLASGFRASLAAFIVGSFFASVAYEFFPYFLVAYTTALSQVTARESIANQERGKIAALTAVSPQIEGTTEHEEAWSTY